MTTDVIIFSYVTRIGIDTAVYQCSDCGALVLARSEGLHVAFHARLAELERAHAGA